jgi:Na+-transporting NADH:ubiquinone oxidoreductase subunit C
MAKKYSNSYIFWFALVMVVIVATGLSLAFAVLKPYQEANRKNEKILNLLQAAGIEADATSAVQVYQEHLISEMMLDPVTGEALSIYLPDGTFQVGDYRAFDQDMKKLITARKAYKEGKTSQNPPIPLFLLRLEGGDTLYIIPMQGRGLWGPVWGNIAVGSDRNTIVGATFDHKSETPGLGAEINQPSFMRAFNGKQLLDENGNFKSVKVVKGGISTLPEDQQIHAVDAISGGTITSDGVTDMLRDCLSHYEPFFKKAQ